MDKQRVLMHGHQGWNVRHGLCHIYMIYVYIWVVYSFCLFCCLFIIVTTQFVALYKPCKPKPKPPGGGGGGVGTRSENWRGGGGGAAGRWKLDPKRSREKSNLGPKRSNSVRIGSFNTPKDRFGVGGWEKIPQKDRVQASECQKRGSKRRHIHITQHRGSTLPGPKPSTYDPPDNHPLAEIQRSILRPELKQQICHQHANTDHFGK